jgi:hypothetical protein
MFLKDGVCCKIHVFLNAKDTKNTNERKIKNTVLIRFSNFFIN